MRPNSKNAYEIQTQKLGGSKGQKAEGRVLNQILRHTAEGWEIEADPRHAELVIEQLGLEGDSAVATPGVSGPDKEDNGDTPDSSRIWDGTALRSGKVVENSKEGFRQFLLNYFDDADILLNKNRMSERSALAKDNALPLQAMQDISDTYIGIAEKIIGHPLNVSQQPKQEIIDVLDQDYGLIR